MCDLAGCRAGYAGLFTAAVPDAAQRTAEGVVASGVGKINARGRFLRWQAALSLRLDSTDSLERVAGWRNGLRGDRSIRVEASPWFMSANMIFKGDEEQLSFATLIRYDEAIAPFLWGPTPAIHRRVAPEVLRASLRRVNGRL